VFTGELVGVTVGESVAVAEIVEVKVAVGAEGTVGVAEG